MSLEPSVAYHRPEADPDPGASVEVSVIMPCLNEARTVGRCIEKAQTAFQRLGVLGEVIVADNGSTDGSREIARGLGARVVEVEERGYGSALRGGIGASLGQLVIMGDADDSYDFAEIGPFIGRLREGDELVMGNRFRGGIMPGAMPWHHRYFGNPVLTGVLNLFFHSPIGDAHCGLRGFRKEAYERLRLSSNGMEFASEMVVRACLQRQRISEVPVLLHRDGRDRPPHLRSFRDGWRHLRFLLLMCPTWLYLVPSAFLIVVGLGLMIWLTPGSRRTGRVMLDVHTMTLGALCTLLSCQMFWMWVHAKVHGWVSGLLPPDAFIRGLTQHFTLERGVLAGGALVLAGLGCDSWLLKEWYARDLGSLDTSSTLRLALWGLTGMVLGAQVVIGSFLVSLQCMGMRSGDALSGSSESNGR
jgi:glycosyltransferase involved in cell wall biosynthesis